MALDDLKDGGGDGNGQPDTDSDSGADHNHGIDVGESRTDKVAYELPTLDAHMAELRKLPEHVVRRYADSLTYFYEKLSVAPPAPQSFEDFSPEDLRHYLRFIEAFYAGGHTAIVRLDLQNRTNDILCGLALLKVSSGTGPLTINQPDGPKSFGNPQKIESICANSLKPEDLHILLKVGQEVGCEYAPIASKLLHAISHNPDFTREASSQDMLQRAKALEKVRIYLCFHSNASIRKLGCRDTDNKSVASPQHRMSIAAHALAVRTQPDEDIAEAYEAKFEYLARMIAWMILHQFYTRHGERLSMESSTDRLAASLTAAGIKIASKHPDKVRFSIDKEAFEESERLLRAVDTLLNNLFGQLFSGLPQKPQGQIEVIDPAYQNPDDTMAPPDTMTYITQVTPELFRSFVELGKSPTMPRPDDEEACERFQRAISKLKMINERFGEKVFRYVPLARDLHWNMALAPFRSSSFPQTDMPSDRARSFNARLLEYADNPYELIQRFNDLLSLDPSNQQGPFIQALMKQIIDAVRQNPEYLKALVGNCFPVDPGRKEYIVHYADFRFFRLLFDKEENLALLEPLCEMLFKPDYKTFYNACLIVADLIEKEKAVGPITLIFHNLLLQSEADEPSGDPNSAGIVRNICERLSPETRKAFLKELAIPRDAEQAEKLFTLLGSYCEEAREASRRKILPSPHVPPEALEGKTDDEIRELMHATFTKTVACFPPVISEKYKEDITYVCDVMLAPDRPFPKSIAHFSKEDLQHFVAFMEAHILSGFPELPSFPGIDIDTIGWMASFAIYRLFARGEISEIKTKTTHPKNVSELEEILAKNISPENLLLLLKLGQDGTEMDAALAAKLLHVLGFGQNFGKESHDELNRRDPALARQFYELLENRDLAIQRLYWNALRYRNRLFNTPTSRVSMNATIFMNRLKHVNPREIDIEKAYEKYFKDFVNNLAALLLEKIFTGSGAVTDDMIQEIMAAMALTAELKSADQPMDVARVTDPAWRNIVMKETERLLIAVREKIAAFTSPDIAEDFMQRCNEEDIWNLPHSINVALCETFLFFTGAVQAMKQNTEQAKTQAFLKLISEFSRKKDCTEYVPLFRETAIELSINEGAELLNGTKKDHAADLLRELGVTAEMVAQNNLGNTVPHIIRLIDNPAELAKVGEKLLDEEGKLGAPEQPALNAVFKAFETHPEYLTSIVAGLIPLPSEPISGKEGATTLAFYRRLFARKHPITKALYDLLLHPAYETFYKACAIVADLIEHDDIWIIGIFGYLFSDLKFDNPQQASRHTAIRNICERLSPEKRTKLLRRYAGMYQGVRVDEWILRMLGNYRKEFVELLEAVAKTQTAPEERRRTKAAARARAIEEREQKFRAPLEFLQSLSSETYGQHDIAGFKREIIEHRTIQLNPDGHDVSLSGIGSPLSSVFSRTRVKRNPETGGTSLACNVILQGAATIPVVYCRLTTQGNLLIRLLDEHGQEKETVDRGMAEAHGIPAGLFDEIHFLVLEVLKLIYVRKPAREEPAADTPASEVSPAASVEPVTEAPSISPSPLSAPLSSWPPASLPPSSPAMPVLVPGLPETNEREAGRMKIDLTEGEIVKQKRSAREERIKIETNRAKALNVFQPLSRGTKLDPFPPPEVSELKLYRCVEMGSERFFVPEENPAAVYEAVQRGERKPDEIFIRRGRAFAQPLTYVRFTRQTGGEPTESRPYFVVRRKSMTDEARLRHDEIFTKEERGESLELGTKRGILHFDAEDHPANPTLRKIFERVKSGVDVPGAIRTLEKEIADEVSELRRKLLAKFLDGDRPNPFEFAARMHRVERGASQRFDALKAIIEELPRKTAEITEQVRDATEPDDPDKVRTRVKLSLPQAGFPFDQTFNQGQFENLAELLGLQTAPPI